MWFFDDIATLFSKLEDIFDDIANRIEEIPLVGSRLARLFDWVAGRCLGIKLLFEQASNWADDVYDSPYSIFRDIVGYLEDSYDILQTSWSDIRSYVRNEIAKIEIPELPTWSDIFKNVRGYFESAYSMLTTTLSTISDFIDVDLNISGLWMWINNSSAWFTNNLTNAKNTIVGFIIDRFEYILDEVFKE
ncbi:hypothetical protein ES705_31044 [subsurface metagenome]